MRRTHAVNSIYTLTNFENYDLLFSTWDLQAAFSMDGRACNKHIKCTRVTPISLLRSPVIFCLTCTVCDLVSTLLEMTYQLIRRGPWRWIIVYILKKQPWLYSNVPWQLISVLLAIHTGFVMPRCRDDEIYLRNTKYESIISPQGVAVFTFQWRILKGRTRFPILMFHGNVFSVSHHFRHNYDFLKTRNYIMVISPLGGAAYSFCWRILKGWTKVVSMLRWQNSPIFNRF